MSDEQIRLVREGLGRYGDGEPGAIEMLATAEFFSYVPGSDEPDAATVLVGLTSDLKAASPDLRIDILDLADGEADTLSGTATISGTWIGELWGAAPSGERYTFEVPVTLRPVGEGFSIRADLDTPAALVILRELELVNPPGQMHLPGRHPVVLPEFLLKLIFTGQAADKPCEHLDDIQVTRSDGARCDDCEPDEIWPALRMCLSCGHVGCCDTSTNKHAKAHWEQTAHPLIRSLHMTEGWMWCYEDNAFLERRVLERVRAQLEAG